MTNLPNLIDNEIASPSDVTLKIHSASVSRGAFECVSGLVTALDVHKLISTACLNPNPREARNRGLIDDIRQTLEHTPEQFEYKSNGIAVTASNVAARERNRFSIDFEDPDKHGIANGGHNLLALMLHHLKLAKVDASNVKTYSDGKELWDQTIQKWSEVERSQFNDEHRETLEKARVPIKIIYPGDRENAAADFDSDVLSIVAGLNANNELQHSAILNKGGHFEHMKASLSPEKVSLISWKEGTPGKYRPDTLVPLSLMALAALDSIDYPVVKDIAPTKLFSSTSAALKVYEAFWKQKGVSVEEDGILKPIDPLFESALNLIDDLTDVWDAIEENFARAYGPGYGKIDKIRIFSTDNAKRKANPKKYTRTPILTRYNQRPNDHTVFGGYVFPLMWGVCGLLKVDKQNKQLIWAESPTDFIERSIEQLVSFGLKAMIRANNYDPGKVGKDRDIYETIRKAVEMVRVLEAK